MSGNLKTAEGCTLIKQSCFMKILLTVVSLMLFHFCFAQQVVDISKEDVRVSASKFFVSGGEPFASTKFVNLVEGTPYYKDEWLKGIVVDNTNYQYKGISLKLDLVENTVHYLDDHEKEFVATTPIKEIILTDAWGNNYKFLHSSSFEKSVTLTKDTWYLWLGNGTASLYKAFKKVISENRPYGSATTEQHISTAEKYLILYNNGFLEVKKIKEVPSLLSNKKKELEEFLKNKDDQKASMDERMIKLIEYYNSLFKERNN